MSTSVSVVGCRAGMPGDGQPSSGYVVTTSASTILLDCGPGVCGALSAITPPDALTAVVISHMHLDHCYDLLPLGKALLSARLSYPGERTSGPIEYPDPITLYVPAGAGSTLRILASLFPVTSEPLLDRAFELAFAIHEYEPDEAVSIGDTTVSFHLLAHASANCGVRITTPSESIAYTGDTGRTDALEDLARGVDVLVCEATRRTPDFGQHGHLCATEAGAVAAAAGADQLILTHFPPSTPEWLEAQRRDAANFFGGQIHVAAPQAKFVVGATRASA